MPLSNLQKTIFALLASHRDPGSFIAGSSYLSRGGDRISGDIDIFHDREERVAQAADEDVKTLMAEGFEVTWNRREPLFYQAIVKEETDSTKLEWVVDSDFRFFPAVKDSEFGYVLHPIDIATNKIMAAAGRREPRDIVDLVKIHHEILPLGAVVCAAVGKSLGFTPEGLINEVKRLAHYQVDDFERVASTPPVDPIDTMRKLRSALQEADEFVRRMPSDKIGLLFMKNGTPVQPDPDFLEGYTTHAGKRQGHWPSSTEISSVMLERYGKPVP